MTVTKLTVLEFKTQKARRKGGTRSTVVINVAIKCDVYIRDNYVEFKVATKTLGFI